MKKWLYAAAAAILGFGFAILSRPARRAKEAEKRHDVLVLDNSKVAKVKAQKSAEKADKLQAEAVLAAEAGRQAVDKVSGQNMREILDAWRQG